MWGESSKNCESNCQCSGLITENFKINSGNNATKRKQEEALTTNYKLKMHPHSLDFKSPTHTPSKRRILGEIQNSSLFHSNIENLKSPLYLSKNTENLNKSPLYLSKNSENINKSPLYLPMNSETVKSPLYLQKNSPFQPKNSPVIERIMTPLKKSPLIDNNSSPLTTRTSFGLKRTKISTSKITKIFEERSKFRMSNKENFSETFMKIDVEEETRDCSFGGDFQETSTNWSMTKLDFTDALQSTSFEVPKPEQDTFVPQKEMQDMDTDFETLHDLEDEFENKEIQDMDTDFETLHDLEDEFENTDNFDRCTKYEIISTDSPDIISRGRSTSRKIDSRNFQFGAPLADEEQSTSFNRPITAKSLNFEDSFEFTSPAVKKTSFSVKKSLKFSETPTKNSESAIKISDKIESAKLSEKFDSAAKLSDKFETPTKYPIRHERSDSSIGSMASFSSSPSCSQLRLFTSESTTSMESGFISELEEPFLELEDSSNSPKVPNFNDLLSGQIKDNFFSNKIKRPGLQRSLSLNPCKAKVSLFEGKKTQKRLEIESETDDVANKRRKSNCGTPEVLKTDKPHRPVLQRAFSENHASIMSAVARSSEESDLIGDFSQPCALPLISGDHQDLKCISADTLAGLLKGDFDDTIAEFKVIDCRYPYEFEGGHIPGAVNLYTPQLVQQLLDQPLDQPANEDGRRKILVFHCEFSLERGPKLYRYLRSTDRSKNRENYPVLNYPEMYLLHKGYSAFFKRYPELCSNGYTAMLDPKHTQMLRKHRSSEEPASFFTHHRSKPGYRLMF